MVTMSLEDVARHCITRLNVVRRNAINFESSACGVSDRDAAFFGMLYDDCEDRYFLTTGKMHTEGGRNIVHTAPMREVAHSDVDREASLHREVALWRRAGYRHLPDLGAQPW